MEIARKNLAFSRLNEGVIKFPESHLWNRGGIFSSAHFKEWYDWSGILTDQDSKEEIGFHFRVQQVVKDGKIVFPYRVCLFKPQSGEVFEESEETFKIETESDNTHDRITFKYEEPKVWSVGFSEKENKWNIKFVKRNSNIALDLEIKTPIVPGFKTMTPEGILPMGIPNGQFFNPFNMHGLSFYYFAPFQSAQGALRIGEQEFNVEGNLWFDHQWGNFASPYFFNSDYKHGMLQLNHNAFVSFNNWNDSEGQEVKQLNQLVQSSDKGWPVYSDGEEAYELNDLSIKIGDLTYEFRNAVELKFANSVSPIKTFVKVFQNDTEVGIAFLEKHQ